MNYLFDDSKNDFEWRRLRKIEEGFDVRSQALLSERGLSAGSRCLELGPGAGGVLRWMLQEVGVSGEVVAVELNPRFIQDIKEPQLKILEGDIRNLLLEENYFDVIHARYVLAHLPEFQSVLQKLIQSLKPGGWLLLEEADFGYKLPSDPESSWGKTCLAVRHAIQKLFSEIQADDIFGRKLPILFQQEGLRAIETKTHAPLACGGSVYAEIMKMSTIHLKDKYCETGAVTEEALQLYCQGTEDPKNWACFYGTISCWGQKK